MRRRHPQPTAGSSPGPLRVSLPKGAALWRAFRRHVKARGRPPGWSLYRHGGRGVGSGDLGGDTVQPIRETKGGRS